MRLRKNARKAGGLSRSAHAGATRVAFRGRVGRRILTAGRYRATIVATDAKRHSPKPRSLAFTVVLR